MTEGLWTEIPARQSFCPLAAAQRIDRVGQADVRQSPVVEGGAAGGLRRPNRRPECRNSGDRRCRRRWRGAHRAVLRPKRRRRRCRRRRGAEAHSRDARSRRCFPRRSELARDKFKERRFAGAVVAHDGSFWRPRRRTGLFLRTGTEIADCGSGNQTPLRIILI